MNNDVIIICYTYLIINNNTYVTSHSIKYLEILNNNVYKYSMYDFNKLFKMLY